MRASMGDAEVGVLTFAEAARCLGVSRQRVQQLVDQGVLTISRRFHRQYVAAASVAAEVERRDRARRGERNGTCQTG